MSRQDKHCTKVDFTGYQEVSANSPSREAPSSKQTPPPHVPSQLNRSLNSKKRDASSPQSESARKVVRGGPKSLGLPQVCEDGTSRRLIVRDESPWDTYRRRLRCTLAGNVFIAAHRSRPFQAVAIREYTKGDVAKMRRLYDILDHDSSRVLCQRRMHVCSCQRPPAHFGATCGVSVSLPHRDGIGSHGLAGMWLLILQLSKAHEFMRVQILNGLCYLNDTGLEHQSLTCRNILLGLDGVIKIGKWHLPPSSWFF
jgi:hypothetical protein